MRPRRFRIAPDRPSACYEAAPGIIREMRAGRGSAITVTGVVRNGVAARGKVLVVLRSHCTRLLIPTQAAR